MSSDGQSRAANRAVRSHISPAEAALQGPTGNARSEHGVRRPGAEGSVLLDTVQREARDAPPGQRGEELHGRVPGMDDWLESQ